MNNSTLNTVEPIALPNGLKFRAVDPQQLGSARFLIKEIYQKKFYDRKGFELAPGQTVLDIGANMGLFALWASQQVGDGRVISIEPTTNCFRTIQNNIAENQLANITALQIALGAESGTLELMEYPGFNAVTHAAHLTPSAWGQFFIKLLFAKYSAEPQRVTVPCSTLEQVLADQQIDEVDMMKIDCEGAEYDIFNASSDSTLQRIRRLVMEFHELHKNHSHQQLVARLESAGFTVIVEKPCFDYWFLKTGTIWATRNS